MNKSYFIQRTVHIRSGKIWENEKLVWEDEQPVLQDFLKNAYRELAMDYPKFFKMDSLSKLAILATEVLFSHAKPDEDTALIFGNSASSLETDEAFSASMNSFPSPSVFVYTLPNIMLGEISIKHRLLSENLFLVMENFDAELFENQLSAALAQPDCANAVCGWVDLHNDEYDVFLCLTGTEGKWPFHAENLQKLYRLNE